MTNLTTFRVFVRFMPLVLACFASTPDSAKAVTLYTCVNNRGVPAGVDVAANSLDEALDVARVKWAAQGTGEVPVKCVTQDEWRSRFTGGKVIKRTTYVCRSILQSYPKEVVLAALPAELDGYRKYSFGAVPNRCWPADQVPVATAPKTDGPFSKLTLGKYFNAIYNGDVDTVQSIDFENLADITGQFIVGLKAYGPMGESIAKSVSIERATLVNPLIRNYLANYENIYGSCLRKDAVRMTFTKTNLRTGGVVDQRDYSINPEFAQAFKATFNAPSWVDLYDLRPPISTVNEGVRQFMGGFKCSDPVVKTFERKLLEMFEKRAGS